MHEVVTSSAPTSEPSPGAGGVELLYCVGFLLAGRFAREILLMAGPSSWLVLRVAGRHMVYGGCFAGGSNDLVRRAE